MLFTSGSKTITHIQAFLQERRCRGIVYLGTVFLHERQRELQAGRVVGAWSGPFDAGASRWLLIPGCKTNNHIQALLAVVLFILDTLFLHERQRAPGRGAWSRPSGEQAGVPRGVGGPQAQRGKLKNTAGGFGEAGWQWGADIFIYARAPDVFFFFFFLFA